MTFPPSTSFLRRVISPVARTLAALFHGDRRDLPNASPAPRSRSTTTIRVEWNNDLDVGIWKFSLAGNDMHAKVKWRCQRCWGSLIGRYEGDKGWTGFKCRVCGTKLEGAAATDEYERLSRETTANLMNLAFGLASKYEDGVFVQRVRVPPEPQPREQVVERVRVKLAQGKPPRRLTRDEFPLGSAGFLFMQASILMAGVSDISHPHETSVVGFSDVEVREDGSFVPRMPVDELESDPQHTERKLMRRMGTTMTEAMIAAFACELAMKAISLTCNDEAKKTHDLLTLFQELPGRSRERIQADYPEIADVIRKGRHTFGAWRYFETSVGEEAIRSIVDVDEARALGKAARVILDEAEFVGLTGAASIRAKRHVRIAGDTSIRKDELTLKFNAGETPPRDNTSSRHRGSTGSP